MKEGCRDVEINEYPWGTHHLGFNTSFGSDGYKHFEKLFLRVYEQFQKDKDQLLQHDFSKYSEEVFSRFDEIEIYNMLFIVLCCANIETLVNMFGVRLMDEEVYKKCIERKSIKDKIKKLYKLHKSESISDPDGILGRIKDMFDKRHELVHPKAKNVTPQNQDEFVRRYWAYDDSEFQKTKRLLADVKTYFVQMGLITQYIADYY